MNNQWMVIVPGEISRTLLRELRTVPIVNDKGTRYLTEYLVARVDELKIEIFSNEHPPPHFRVLYGKDSANFSIPDCRKLNGGLDQWEKTIKQWHSTNKDKLIEVWNARRPTDCLVGLYKED